uniref:hypothetical protein n=1 Tax=uncultured Methylobacterium sp. TaxID=157278 RepID=UPI0035CA3F81
AGGAKAVRGLGGSLSRWGAVVYGTGFLVFLFGGWYSAGVFDVSLLVLALWWPLILTVFGLGTLFRYLGG